MGRYSNIKKVKLERCDKFIEASENYYGRFESMYDMRDHLIDWFEEDSQCDGYWENASKCSYCNKYWSDIDGCSNCPLCKNIIRTLRDIEFACCEGLHSKVMKSKSRDEFLQNLKKYREYIRING